MRNYKMENVLTFVKIKKTHFHFKKATSFDNRVSSRANC